MVNYYYDVLLFYSILFYTLHNDVQLNTLSNSLFS